MFSALLAARGIDPAKTFALRTSLHPLDRGGDFQSTAGIARNLALDAYQRMHNGRVFGREADVLCFIAEPGGKARFTGFKRFTLRRKGIVPADIVYDYDAAHLLHSFLARARHPVFYDAFDLPGLDDLKETLVINWPRPIMRSVLRASAL